MLVALLILMGCKDDCRYKLSCDDCTSVDEIVESCPVDTGGNSYAGVKECDDGYVRVSCSTSYYHGEMWWFGPDGKLICKEESTDDASFCGGYTRRWGDCSGIPPGC